MLRWISDLVRIFSTVKARRVVKWMASGVVAVAAAVWGVFVYFDSKPKSDGSSREALSRPACNSVVVGRDANGSNITVKGGVDQKC
jgi:hypothetical protein